MDKIETTEGLPIDLNNDGKPVCSKCGKEAHYLQPTIYATRGKLGFEDASFQISALCKTCMNPPKLTKLENITRQLDSHEYIDCHDDTLKLLLRCAAAAVAYRETHRFRKMHEGHPMGYELASQRRSAVSHLITAAEALMEEIE